MIQNSEFKIIEIEGRPLDELIQKYESLVRILMAHKYSNNSESYAEMLLNWLRSTDFYSAPASTRYHESVVGGLLVHTLNVYNNILVLARTVPQFQQVDEYSAVLVSLVHDWCKIGYYAPYEKNVKNETTGQWEKQIAFKVEQTSIPLGHGVTSMFLASRFFKLSSDEALAIRWHMSRFRVCEDEINEFQLANETYPLVHLVQFADQLSITSYANHLITSKI